MAHQSEPWFWWEQDGVPIKKSWLVTLDEAYKNSGKQFLAYRAGGFTCGLMMYPPRVGQYCLSALLTISKSWDTVICDNASGKIAFTNLIQHLPHSGEKHFEGAIELGLIEQGAVIFHRCKDGSLQECISRMTIQDVGTKMVEVCPNTSLVKAKNLCIFVYLPPPGVGHTEVFLKNLRDFPPHNRVFMISEHPWPGVTKIVNPVSLVGKDYQKIYNLLLVESLRIARKEGYSHMLYLETDCRVKGDDWDDRIYTEFLEHKQAILGGCLAICGDLTSPAFNSQFTKLTNKYNSNDSNGVKRNWPIIRQGNYRTNHPIVFVNGAPAIYEVKAILEIIEEEQKQNNLAQVKVLDADLGWMIGRKFGILESFNKIVHLPLVLATGGETIIPFSDRTSQLTDLKVAAIHSIKTRWRPTKRCPRFYFSGDLGDIIYSLKAMKLFGGGELWLGPELKSKYPPRDPIQLKGFEFLEQLIRCQPYVKDVRFCPTHPADNEIDYDFNSFRELWSNVNFRHDTGINRLFEMMTEIIGVRQLVNEESWLEIGGSESIMPVVINRSFRYQQSEMPWSSIMAKVRNSAVFVGFPQEHARFASEFGQVCYYSVKDSLELARIIAGAKWFIGNQSFPLSLALGLGVPTYHEMWLQSPDCVFKRPGAFTWKDPIEVIQWT
jgi:hypothetical protein